LAEWWGGAGSCDLPPQPVGIGQHVLAQMAE